MNDRISPQAGAASKPADGDADEKLTVAPASELPDVDPRKLIPLPAPPAPEAEPLRYSLAELLAVVTLAGVLFASIRLVGAAVFAATAGVVGFLMLVFISILKPARGIIHVAWWVLMVVYVVAAIAAFFVKDS